MNHRHPLHPFFGPNAPAFPGQAFPGPIFAPAVPGPVFPGELPSNWLNPTAHLPVAVQAVLAKPVSYFKELASKKPEPFEQPLTHIAFALDKSTSMGDAPGKKESTIEGFNTQVNRIQNGAKTAGETRFTEVQFGSESEVRGVATSLDRLQPLNDENYKPDGMTALYDGIGDTIAALLGTAGIERASTAVLLTAFTDGGENHSKRYSAQTLKDLIERLEATGRWTFALVGPKGSVTQLASMLAIKPLNVRAYNPESVAERRQAFASVSGATESYMNLRSVGGTQSACLYADPNGKV